METLNAAEQETQAALDALNALPANTAKRTAAKNAYWAWQNAHEEHGAAWGRQFRAMRVLGVKEMPLSYVMHPEGPNFPLTTLAPDFKASHGHAYIFAKAKLMPQ